MSPASRWLAYLSPSNIRGHQRWLKAGRQGSGRIVLEEINLRGASLALAKLLKLINSVIYNGSGNIGKYLNHRLRKFIMKNN